MTYWMRLVSIMTLKIQRNIEDASFSEQSHKLVKHIPIFTSWLLFEKNYPLLYEKLRSLYSQPLTCQVIRSKFLKIYTSSFLEESHNPSFMMNHLQRISS